MEETGQEPKTNPAEVDTLRLLRDALVKAAKRRPPRNKRGRVPGGSKG